MKALVELEKGLDVTAGLPMSPIAAKIFTHDGTALTTALKGVKAVIRKSKGTVVVSCSSYSKNYDKNFLLQPPLLE
jgi:hypothetical protein